MVPDSSNNIIQIQEEEYATKTYRVDKSSGHIGTFIDGQEAYSQFVNKVISTEKNVQVIYDDFGVELEDLSGQDADFVQANLEHRIREALFQDARTVSVDNFTFKAGETKDAFLVSFTATSIYATENYEANI